MAAAGLFLACKLAEEGRTVSQVVGACWEAENEKNRGKVHACKGMEARKEQICREIQYFEFDVLLALNFCVHVEVPYEYLSALIPTGLQREEAERLHRVALNFCNDSLHSEAYLLFPVSQVANACVYLAGLFCCLETGISPLQDCVESVVQVYKDALSPA